MRKNNGRRRHRGQNRRNFNNLNKNTVIESFGPISQIRGNVQQLNEKYNNLFEKNINSFLDSKDLVFTIKHYKPLLAPIEKDQKVADLIVKNKNSEIIKKFELFSKNEMT